jgi:hypothetical protein
MMEAARTSETLVNFYQTTRCYNPEDSHLHTLKLVCKMKLFVSMVSQIEALTTLDRSNMMFLCITVSLCV